jgi:hypothetical protein
MASGGVRVVGNCTRSQVRPASIVLACADANSSLTHLKWSSFGGSTARATGDYTYNDCTPTCVAGHFHSYPVTIVFSAPKRCPDGHRDYQVAAATFSSAVRPSGSLGRRGKPGKLSLVCPLGGG